MKIGVIDSGIGGITTLREVMKSASADYYYFSTREIFPILKRATKSFLISQRVSLINYLYLV